METKLLFGQYRLLHYMKLAQNKPSDNIHADLFANCLYTADVPDAIQRTVELPGRLSSELASALTSLEEKGCIQKLRGDGDDIVYRMTYDGRRRFQSAMADLGRFCLTSVFVPILVSAVTALITVAITR